MNTADLLAATFAEHEADAPDPTETLRAIEADIARPTRRRPTVAVAATVATAAAVVAIALVSVQLRPGDGDGTGRQTAGAAPSPRTSPLHSAPDSKAHPIIMRFRPGWLPAGAKFDNAEVGTRSFRLLQYHVGNVPNQKRGLTVWSDDGPLLDRLRDGGTLHRITIHGRPAVEGASPGARSYTISIMRSNELTVTVLAYGWNRKTVSSYATHIAQDLQYGKFPVPRKRI